MHKEQNIFLIEDIKQKKVIIPQSAGVYAFWWMRNRDCLLNGKRNLVLKGPKGNPVKVEYRDWWPHYLKFPCLYVGKSTNLRKRYQLHLKRGSPGRLHPGKESEEKIQPVTTSCQLRWGIEHIFPDKENSLEIIDKCVGFSWRADFSDNAVVERFFEEDRMIGLWRPWFNIDSER